MDIFKRKSIKIIYSKVFLASSIGNVLEFYDFATYGFLIPIMAPLFFPAVNPINSIIMGCGVFAISFLARPLGGYLFGYIGDKHGRKIAFSLSLILMAMTTFGIGVLPTYEQVGLLAPLLLCCLRLIQGLCLGGEFSGSLIYATEYYSQQQRIGAFITSSITSAGVSGWFLSSIICTFCVNLGVSYSWRIPFFVGVVVGIIGYYLRRSNLESPVKLTPQRENFLTHLKSEWMTACSMAGIGALMGGVFYGLYIFPNTFLPTHFSSISPVQALQCTSLGIGFYMIFLPIMGWLSDHLGHIKCMILFTILTILLSYPIVYCLMSGNLFFIISSGVFTAFILSGFMGPATYIMARSFKPNYRYRLVSISYNVGASLFGGITPGIFLILIEKLNLLYGPGLYITVCGFIGLLSSIHLYKKHKTFDDQLNQENVSILGST